MTSSPYATPDREPLISVLESRVIPCWERFGMERFAVTAQTEEEFNLQTPPELMRTSVKKRMGRKVTARSRRVFNNTSSFLESWPEDSQAVFRYPTLVFVVEGQADFPTADYVIHCPQDHFLLFGTGIPRPIGNQTHFEGGNHEHRTCAVLWFFAPPGTNSITAYICYSQGKKHWSDGYRIVHRLEVVQLFKLLIQEMEDEAPEAEKFTSLSFQTFLHFFLRELRQGRFHQEGKLSSTKSQEITLSSIGEAVEYIKTHINQPLTAAKVAEQVYMSRNNFLKQFTREMGQTFHQFVIERKMDEAQRLLSDGHWSVTYICRFVGLRPTQFRAQFKKHFGVPPSQFRRLPAKKGAKPVTYVR